MPTSGKDVLDLRVGMGMGRRVEGVTIVCASVCHRLVFLCPAQSVEDR